MTLPISTTTIGQILTAIKTQLISESVFSAGTVYVGNKPEKNDIQASTTYCVVTPGDAEVIDEEITTVSQDVFVTVWNYLSLDQDVRDDYQDTSASGILAVVDSIAGALNLLMLVSADSTSYLVVEPIRIKSVQRVEAESRSWAVIRVRFNVKYGWDYLPPFVAGAFSDGFNDGFVIGSA